MSIVVVDINIVAKKHGLVALECSHLAAPLAWIWPYIPWMTLKSSLLLSMLMLPVFNLFTLFFLHLPT